MTTKEQEFWGLCGFTTVRRKEVYDIGYYTEYQYQGHSSGLSFYPPIDLNNLWEYAAPVVVEKIMAEQECSSDLAYAILFKKWLQELQLDIPHADKALFKVCYKALGEKE